MNIGDVTLTLGVVNKHFLEYVSPNGEFTFTVARQKRHGFPIHPGAFPKTITVKVWIDSAEAEAKS